AEGVILETAKLRFDYSGSDPAAVVREGSHDPYRYTPAPGAIRLWFRDANVARSATADYIAPGQFIWASAFGLGPARTATVWVEAVTPSAALGDRRITVSVDPDGDGQGLMPQDAVRLTAVKADLGFNHSNNSPTLKDGTPDVEWAIDEYDELMEERDPGFQFWWSRDLPGSQIEAHDLPDLVPFTVNVPEVALDLGW